MKRIWKTRKDEAVSPVIATILMVAITVVLAAVLYVMVMGMVVIDPVVTPLGLSKSDHTTTSITILVSSAPDDAKVEGTQFSLDHNNGIGIIDGAIVYDGNGVPVAWYNGTVWEYSGHTADTLDYTSGMKIIVSAPAISAGDKLTISSAEERFGLVELEI